MVFSFILATLAISLILSCIYLFNPFAMGIPIPLWSRVVVFLLSITKIVRHIGISSFGGQQVYVKTNSEFKSIQNWELIFYLLQTFCPHLGIFFSFCVVSSFTTFQPNFTSGLLQVILPRPRIGMMSLVTVFPVITAFHSCCLSHHVFDQVNLWLAWVGFETAIFWQCSPGTVETQRLYLLRHRPRRAIKDWLFVLINPYLVFYSRVHTEFL